MPRKKQRPFFSIIIPCYNDGRYAPKVYLDRLLSSILKQGLKKSEYEVIISDDHSVIPYKETLDKYARRIAIKYIETDYNFAPGNTRQKGVSVAEGEWICFADHDDIFYPQALSRVRAAIKSSGEQYIVYSNFDKVDSCTSKLLEVFRGVSLSTWVHGKFYNLDNLWKPYNLHFIKDLKTHEDLALGKYVECILHKLNRDPCYFNECTYMWCYSEDSVSHRTYVDIADEFGCKHNFLETHFNDFLISQIEPFFEAYKEGYMTRNELIPMFLSSFSSAYLSFCSFRVANPQGYIKQNEVYCSRFWNRFKQLADIKLVSIKVILRSTFREKLKELDAKTKSWMLPTLIEWLSQIDEMDASLDLTDDIRTNTSILLKCQDEGENSLTRPFFSIIIPCYNDGRYQEGKYLDRLLSSIARQDFPKSQVEVILADDCSPVPFDDIINKWSERLMIKYIKTDYNFAPGNTRAKGLTIATGEWLAFADHDDIYYPEAFSKIKNGILEKNEKHFIFGDFNGVDETGRILRTYECHLNWCHAKFYNKDNLWDKYNIHFIHDLKSHEDIAICTQVSCILSTDEVKDYTYVHAPIYAWTDNPESVSHAKYTVDTESGPREFLEVFFDDYLRSTGWIYLDRFKIHAIKMQYAVKSCLEIICYAYFYMQGFQFRRPNDFYQMNVISAAKYVNEVKRTFNIDNEAIYNVVASNKAYMYYDIRRYADPGSGLYIPTQTFKQWLEWVSPKG